MSLDRQRRDAGIAVQLAADEPVDTEAVTHFTPVDTSKIKDWRER
jgi:hypothetical protein